MSIGWKVTLIGLIAIIGVSFASTYGSNNTVSSAAPVSTPYEAPAESEITPDMIVDTLGPATIQRLCRGYAVVGEAGFAAFDASYTHADPSAREVFNEILSRC
jgi:hypothetical protein